MDSRSSEEDILSFLRVKDFLAPHEIEETADRDERDHRESVGMGPFEERIVRRRPFVQGRVELIEHACKKAKVDGSEAIALMQPEVVVSTALALFGIDLDAESSSPT